MTRPHPDFWHPVAALLIALRKLLRATAPDDFAAIARDARARLAALTALVRRYVHLLAAGIILPPPRPVVERILRVGTPGAPRGEGYLFPLFEAPSVPSRPAAGKDPPALQWALLLQAVDRLARVLADPAPHARRLARRFGTLETPGLRDLPVRWHVIRRIDPAIDVLLCRLDAAVRPEAWAGIGIGDDTS